MDVNLEHEDLLIRLRGKLNEDSIKLWETPYLLPDQETSASIKDLATKYATDLSTNYDTTLAALRELQTHSIDRSKANVQFKETGCATLRVRATVPGEKPRVLKVEKKLDIMGRELMDHMAVELNIDKSRIKLIHNGKMLKPTHSLEEQGVKNSAQIMALVMAETEEESKKEDRLYMEMASTRDDATLLSEYVDLWGVDDYIKLEDQSGKEVEVPLEERRSLMVGLALHERGRAAIASKDYALALVLLLEADRQLSECRSAVLSMVDNWAVLQLDVAWCYLRLHSLHAAADAAARLQRARAAIARTYDQRRDAASRTAANERVLFMRLYLLQGIVAYHQNKRSEARQLLDKAQQELNALRVDEESLSALMELGWSRAQARAGLRATGGQLDAAHHYLVERTTTRENHRRDHTHDKLAGIPTSALVQALLKLLQERGGGGPSARAAAAALRDAGNDLAAAATLLQQDAHLYADTDSSTEGSSGSSTSQVVPDENLVEQLESLGYCSEHVRTALKLSINKLSDAIDLLVTGALQESDPQDPSTSSGVTPIVLKHLKRDKKRKEREEALRRLKSSIKSDEDDYLDSSLAEEEVYLAQYKSLL